MLAPTQRNVAILAFTLVVVMLGYGIVMPILPFYIQRLGASGRDLGLLTAISALMQLFFAPLWGSLSDRVGRKPVLLVGVFGYALTLLLFGLSTRLWMLFAARALNGMLSSATMPTALAYITDNTTAKERGGGMGQLGAAMGIGVVLGPGLGGVLSTYSLATPFFVAAGLCLVSLVLVWLFLPESLPATARREPAQPKATAFGQIWRSLVGPLGIMLVMAFVVSFGLSSFQGILGLYALRKFGYGPEQVGVIWMVVGGVLIVGQGALTGWLTKRWGEVTVIRVSLLTSALSYALILLAATYLTVLVTTGLFILFIALLGPALNALIASQTTMKQGFTLGLSNSFTSLGRILGPVWGGSIFDLNLNYPFLSGAAILLFAFVISLLWMRDEHQPAALAPAKN
jgi:MFS transporter, DHA1 family, multidrug resistance protein